ncbi:MAG: hypothetical protein HY744_16210 [Deltaproteobacteria bacterium]|nr:hypothetical protein [Deltaproteobacteria bacterium]
MERMGWTATIVLAALCAATALGCKENAAATGACKGAKSSDECSECCKTNGASGHKYIGGDCGCLGG